MLVYRQDGNLAYKPEEEIEETTTVQKRQRKQTIFDLDYQISVKTKKKVLKGIVLGCAVACFVLSRFAVVSKANLALISMQNNVEAKQSQIADLEANISSAVELNTVQERATALGMSFPDSESVVALAVVPYEQLVAENVSDEEATSTNVIREIID